jgi:ligand-binding SRPBCC domain-containing protein
MRLYQLTQTQNLALTLSQAWEFFSDPGNLAEITPSYLKFEILSELPSRIYPGEIIEYRVRPLWGIPLTWITEIAQVEEPYLFVDRQLKGPYKIWHHEHHFKEINDGIAMRDIVSYALPGGLFSTPLHPMIVKPKLEAIFNFRRLYLEKRFGFH